MASDTVFRDVTKTKPSHYNQGKAATAAKPTEPSTYEGSQLAEDIKTSTVADDIKARLIREIIEYEATHGKCTQTFTKKIRKQIRP